MWPSTTPPAATSPPHRPERKHRAPSTAHNCRAATPCDVPPATAACLRAKRIGKRSTARPRYLLYTRLSIIHRPGRGSNRIRPANRRPFSVGLRTAAHQRPPPRCHHQRRSHPSHSRSGIYYTSGWGSGPDRITSQQHRTSTVQSTRPDTPTATTPCCQGIASCWP